MNDSANSDTAKAVTSTGVPSTAYYPGWFGQAVIAISLVLIIVVRIIGRSPDPPFPLNDPAIGNLLVLLFGFIAVVTTWIWFCFQSHYSMSARRVVLIAPVVMVALMLGTVWVVGFNRIFELDGSMGLRLALFRGEPRGFRPTAETKTANLTTTTPLDFPQFLGPDRSCWIAGPELFTDWKVHPPKLVWKQLIGPGWSAFAAVNGYAVTIEQRGDEEWVTCYEITTGKPLWGHSIVGRHENPMGGIGPRSTPTIHSGRVYALGATGILRC